jgi:hypothetical protein
MPIPPLEALADAIMNAEGWRPGSPSNRNRNPGNLRSGLGEVSKDVEGYAQFSKFEDGYHALLFDVTVKVRGGSEHKLTPTSTLEQFSAVYAPSRDGNDPYRYTKMLIWWLEHALKRQFTSSTTLAELMNGTTPPADVPEVK